MKLNEFKLERYFAKYEFKTAYNLCASDCEPLTINDLLEMEEGSLSALKKQGLGYTESAGDPELLELVSGLYTTIIPDQILTFSGAEEAIFIFMNVLLNPGDHIIVQFPAYQSLFEIAQTIGCKVTLWELDSLNDWELDLQVLLDDINPRTRAIIINFPHNPTGTHISRQKLNQIIDIAQENNIYLFSDEVYRLLEYNSLQRLPAVCDLYDNGVSLGVMSKAFGLAGLRIGWISSPNRELLKQLSMFKDYTTICNSASSEFLAKIALKQVDTIVERNLNIINQNHELFSEFFANFKEFFNYIPPKAGSVAFPCFKSDSSFEQFYIDLAREKNVLLLPGSTFNYPNRYFRIGFGRKGVAGALDLLSEFINSSFLVK